MEVPTATWLHSDVTVNSRLLPLLSGLLALGFGLGGCQSMTRRSEAPLSWGDQGDGSFRNPVLFADYSDPDLIRVGEDFYLVASEFHFMGIQILHSRDLVNWRIVGRLFDRLEIDPKYASMRAYAEGTWAPTLRYHQGRFLLYVCTPHDGLLRWSAERPEGPWTLAVVKRVDKWEDPCPFWDEDGKAYLVHSVHGAGPLILHRMSDDGLRLLDEGVEIYRGPVAEGPKLFRREGWYYISLPEGGVEKGGQTVLRSRKLYGPYARREVLPGGSPHQGGLVDLDNGESWFIGFKSSGAFGRVAHLEPVRWGEDGWPVFGDQGSAVERARKPGLQVRPVEHPVRDDDFSARTLGLQWQWNHNPVDSAWSLSERPGWLRFHPQPAEAPRLARNTLTQKLWGPEGTVTVRLDPGRLAEGDQAGLAFLCGKDFHVVGAGRRGGRLCLLRDGTELAAWGGDVLYLKAEYIGAEARLFWSSDGRNYQAAGGSVTLRWGQWKGARIGLHSFGLGDGSADFDDFHYELPSPPPAP